MKLKQLLLIIGVSAVSAIGSVWVYSKVTRNQSSNFVQSQEGKVPVNYAGFTENGAGVGEPIDFTKAAGAAVPAVVHIKTRIPAKKISNQLPRSNRNNIDDWFDQFSIIHSGSRYSLNKELQEAASSSAMMVTLLPITMSFPMEAMVWPMK